MQTYYFDMKDGVPIRDRAGLEFRTDSQAIEHSKELARRFRHEHPVRDDNLCVVVVSETGAEIHREPVYPDATRPPPPGSRDLNQISPPTLALTERHNGD